MKKTISALAICSIGLFAVNSHAAMHEKQIMERLESLQKTVATQQELIVELKKQVDQNSEKVETTSETSAITLANKAIDQLKIKGDLRVRYERRDTDYKNSDDDYARDRWRTRFRIGGVWNNKQEDWEVGAGLATGGNGATSTNDTWSDDEPFETGDIRIDYAYAKHKMDDFAFTLGQHKKSVENLLGHVGR